MLKKIGIWSYKGYHMATQWLCSVKNVLLFNSSFLVIEKITCKWGICLCTCISIKPLHYLAYLKLCTSLDYYVIWNLRMVHQYHLQLPCLLLSFLQWHGYWLEIICAGCRNKRQSSALMTQCPMPDLSCSSCSRS